MSGNKMLTAYRTLLNHAKESYVVAEQNTWQVLGQAIEKTEQADHALAELTSKEFAQVQADVQADIMQTAEYFADVEKGVEEFITMDLPVLEQLLIDKALTLADPTNITVLRMRLAAALDENHPVFGHQTKQ
ncbi:MAG: zinc ribbon-containing protein [Gammaproteobacteria bacterium]|nr:zinc ribbon-containing protein [Gammaproteobacteria bacterium]